MSRFSSVLLVLIAFALLGQMAVASFAPNLTKFASTANPSGWCEETAEEDEAGEDDEVAGGMPVWPLYVGRHSVPFTFSPFELRDQSPEIFVPPPQA